MPLIEMTSDLTSLKFGRDRRGGGDSGQPYFTKDIPGRLQSINSYNTGFLGSDFLVRGGVGSGISIREDGERLLKFFADTKSVNGLLFTAKQNALSLQSSLTGAGPGRFYLPTSTLAQAAVNPLGIHLNKQGTGILPRDDKYFTLTKDSKTETGYNTNVLGDGNRNKLLLLYETKIISPTSNSLTFKSNLQKFGISGDPTQIQSYIGGPNSLVGNRTKIGRVFDTQEGIINNKYLPSGANQFVLYTPNLIVNKTIVGNTRSTTIGGNISNFTQDFVDPPTSEGFVGPPRPSETGADQDRVKQLIGKPTNYTDFNRNKTYGEPDAGNYSVTRDRSVYYDFDLKNNILTGTERDNIYRPDKINSTPLYVTGEESAKAGTGYDDIVKFNIGVIDLDGTSESRNTTWIHFRAYINSFNDQYTSTFNPVKYMGRGNSFYKYDGYTRAISMDFRVVVHSKYEQSIIYDKLNYLASVTAPNYSAGWFMRVNLIKVTVGDYLNNTIGILNGLSYSIPQESPWDIGRNSDGKQDNNSLQMPFIIDVGGFSFTPIHNFIDKTVPNSYITEGKEKPDQRYISLGAGGKGYAINKNLRNIENGVKAEEQG